MQYRPPNTNLDSCSQRVYKVTGDNGCRHLLVIATDQLCWSFNWCVGVFIVDCRHNQHIMLVTQLHYTDKCIVKIMKVYIERINLIL